MDNDEDYNLVGTTNDMLVWYENIGSQEYVRHNVSSTLRLVSSQGIYATDVNNDTYIDIIIAIGYEFVGIYYNSEDQSFTLSILYSYGDVGCCNCGTGESMNSIRTRL